MLLLKSSVCLWRFSCPSLKGTVERTGSENPAKKRHHELLILTWFVFGLTALLFIPVCVLLHKLLGREDTLYLTAAILTRVLSGVLQSFAAKTSSP
ncbi:DUF4386 family protein [Brasilonema sennae]|uniref:DUF4386 family protein n=1 Tax=Brasilonema sennae TaxID=1397703 RepID=UPI001B7D1B6C|nr:DUF4386 family protein [Brasilonema sennae]